MSKSLFDAICNVICGLILGVGVSIVLNLPIKKVERKELLPSVKCPLCDESALLYGYDPDNYFKHVYTYKHKVDRDFHVSEYDKNYVLKQARSY